MSKKTLGYQEVASASYHTLELKAHAVRGTSSKEHAINVNILRCSYELWFSLLADLSLMADLSIQHTANLCSRLAQLVNSMTYTELSDMCGECYDKLRQLPSYESYTYSRFKGDPSVQPFIRVLRPFLEKLHYSRDPEWLERILTMCVYPFRTRVVDEGLQTQMLQDFLTIESQIAENDMKGYPSQLVDELHRHAVRYLREWNYEQYPIIPSLTSGSVSDETLHSRIDKYVALTPLPSVDLMLAKEGAGRSVEYLPFYGAAAMSWAEQEAQLDWRDSIERIIFVPKNATKLRTVCCQPVSYQYWQAGVQRSIYRYFRDHPELGQHIPLFDTSVVHRFVLKGSDQSLIGTLDLSAASDRISWQLVRQVFEGTRYGEWLEATRVTYSRLPNNSIIKSNKAFAMGACLCFPTMSLLIFFILAYACEIAGVSLQYVTVVGDDIVGPNRALRIAIKILIACGLVVNITKSFYGDNDSYREGCGMEAWNGYDITPMRFPRTFDPNANISSQVSCLVDMANECYCRSYRLSRLTLLRRLGELGFGPYGDKPIRFVPNPERDKQLVFGGGLFTPYATNYKAKSRTHVRFRSWHWVYPPFGRVESFCATDPSQYCEREWEYKDVYLGHTEYYCTYVGTQLKMPSISALTVDPYNSVDFSNDTGVRWYYDKRADLYNEDHSSHQHAWELSQQSLSTVQNVVEEIRLFDWYLTHASETRAERDELSYDAREAAANATLAKLGVKIYRAPNLESGESMPMDKYAFEAQRVPSLRSGWQPLMEW